MQKQTHCRKSYGVVACHCSVCLHISSIQHKWEIYKYRWGTPNDDKNFNMNGSLLLWLKFFHAATDMHRHISLFSCILQACICQQSFEYYPNFSFKYNINSSPYTLFVIKRTYKPLPSSITTIIYTKIWLHFRNVPGWNTKICLYQV